MALGPRRQHCEEGARRLTFRYRNRVLFLALALLLGFPGLRYEPIDYSLDATSGGLVDPVPTPSTLNRPFPTPILVVGLPKTGTSTIFSFFNQSGYRSSHYKCNGLFCGLCIKSAIKKGKPPLKSCGNYEVFAQMDVENFGSCHIPQISNLQELHQEAPNATFLLSLRNMSHWSKSVTNWGGGNENSMARRFYKACDKSIAPLSKSREDLETWHNQHIERIRMFVREHPSHPLIEIDIEDPGAGQRMATLFQSDARYWGHVNDSVLRKVSLTNTRDETAS